MRTRNFIMPPQTLTTPTGEISLQDVNVELGTAGQINMNRADVRGLAEVPAGAISMSDLQGKSAIRTKVYTGPFANVGGEPAINANDMSPDNILEGSLAWGPTRTYNNVGGNPRFRWQLQDAGGVAANGSFIDIEVVGPTGTITYVAANMTYTVQSNFGAWGTNTRLPANAIFPFGNYTMTVRY